MISYFSDKSHDFNKIALLLILILLSSLLLFSTPAFAEDPLPSADRTKWAPQTGELTITPLGNNEFKIRSTFKWADVSGFQTPHTAYEHEIVFENWDLFECKYSLSVASNVVQYTLGNFVFEGVHKPLSECLSLSVSSNLEGYYVDTRLFDTTLQGEVYTIGTTSVPTSNKDYFVEFTSKASTTVTDSRVRLHGSLGHWAGRYDKSNSFSPISELGFCTIADFWMDVKAACVFESQDSGDIIPYTNYHKGDSFYRSWNLTPTTPPNPQPPQNPPGACANKSNGNYCGVSIGMPSSLLYNCTNGVATAIQSCSAGCSAQPSGTNDFCTVSTPPGGGGTGNTCPNGQNGLYCGASVGLDSSKLYNCQNGVKTLSQSCSYGCIQKPPGTADVCASPPTGGSCPSGNGDYCGSTLGLDSNKLYYCSNGNVSLKQQCGSGCKINPPGTADVCYNTGGDGGSKVTLYGNSGYDPNSIRHQFGPGEYNDPVRGSHYKSMYIPSGWSVVLNDAALNNVGRNDCFNSSQSNLETNGWYNSIESIKVYSTNVCPAPSNDWVKICRSTGWWGDHQSECMTVNQDLPSLNGAGFGNDVLRSIDIGGSWEAILFEDDNYAGRRYVVSDTKTDLGGIPFGYGASSMKVRRRSPAAFTLYRLGDYNGGNPFSSDRTINDLDHWNRNNGNDDDQINDRAESIRVASGYEIIACTDSNFRGNCGRTNHDISDLNALASGLRDGLSSILVCQGTCPSSPVNPTNVSPVDGQSIAPNTPVTFSWAGNGSEYYLEYWGGGLASGEVRNSGWRTELTFTVSSLPTSSEPYSWRVRAWNSSGKSGWSPTHTFKVENAQVVNAAPVQAYVNGSDIAPINTSLTYTVLVSPSNAANLNYTWSPAPQSGQGSATATYKWNGAGTYKITVNINNTAGSVTASKDVIVGCPLGQYLTEYFPNKTLSGTPVSITCESNIHTDWAYGGPSSVGTDNFSIRWSGNIQFNTAQYKFKVNVDDGLRLFVNGSNVLDRWVDGYTMTEVPINMQAGVRPVVMEYYENGGAAHAFLDIETVVTNPPDPEPPVVAPCAPGQYQAKYFNNTTFAGEPVLTRCETKVANKWGAKSPAPGIVNVDGWSVKWEIRFVVPAQAVYKFRLTNDETARFYWRGLMLMQNTSPTTAVKTGQSSMSLTQGTHILGMDFVDKAGSATAILSITKGNTAPTVGIIPTQSIFQEQSFANINLSDHLSHPDIWDPVTWSVSGNKKIQVSIVDGIASMTYPQFWSGTEVITFKATDSYGGVGSRPVVFKVGVVATCPVGQYKAQYFATQNLTGKPLFTQCESEINHDWAGGAPIPGMPENNFSVRWTGSINFATKGVYRFGTYSDDGVRLYVDNVLLIDNWTDHAGTLDFRAKSMTAGKHAIRMDYYENGGGALATLQIAGPTSCVPGQGEYCVDYYNNIDLADTPVFSTTEKSIIHAWGVKGPGNGVNTDFFSGRWTGYINMKAGLRKFTVSSDDGVRLYIDNQLILDDWSDHATKTVTIPWTVTAGYHLVRLEYYEKGGGAVAKLTIK